MFPSCVAVQDEEIRKFTCDLENIIIHLILLVEKVKEFVLTVRHDKICDTVGKTQYSEVKKR